MDNLRLFILGFKIMKKLMMKAIVLTVGVYIAVIGVNYVVDPANLYHMSLIDEMVSALSKGKIIETQGDYSQGMLVKGIIDESVESPRTLILGSSQTMYLPWEEIYDGVLVGGLSNAHMGDYYAVLGMVESRGYMPERVVIGVDPWAFYTDALSGSSSVAKYAQYEKKKIEGKEVSLDQLGNESKIKGNLDKIKELVSFPYFQSSITNLRMNGVGFYLHRKGQQVKFAEDGSVGDKMKLMPDCRLIMSFEHFRPIEETEAGIQSMIDSGSLGTLKDGFVDLPIDNLREFEDMVEYLQKKGVEVEIYLPAQHPLVYEFIKNDEGFQGVLKLEKYLRAFGERHEIVVHGSYNPELTEVAPEDFVDGSHLKPDRMLDSYNTIVDFE